MLLVAGGTPHYLKVTCQGTAGYISDAYTREKLPGTIHIRRARASGTKAIRHRVRVGTMHLGMLDYKMQDTAGSPGRVNKTVGLRGVHRQWVYSGEGYCFHFAEWPRPSSLLPFHPSS